MTRYLLDTTALIDYSKGSEPTLSRIDAMIAAGDEICVTAVGIAEFYSGVAPQERALRRAFLNSLRYLDITREAARRAGEYRYHFARRGQTLSTPDALVAAVAREYSAVIVTDNLRDYPMDDVQLLSLRT